MSLKHEDFDGEHLYDGEAVKSGVGLSPMVHLQTYSFEQMQHRCFCITRDVFSFLFYQAV